MNLLINVIVQTSYLENIKQASKIKNLIFFHFLIINNSFSVYLKELLYLINYSAPKVPDFI